MSRLFMKVAVIVLSLLLVLGTFGCSSNEQQAVETPKSETPRKKLHGTGRTKICPLFLSVHPVETKLAAEWKKAIEEGLMD